MTNTDYQHLVHWRVGRLASLGLISLALLSGCGGGGSDSGGNGNDGWIAGVFRPASNFANRCANPRSGQDPWGNTINEVQGSTVTENNWLRSMSNDLYLWYDEIIDRNPNHYATSTYFNSLRTNQTTPSGRPKDRFHYSYTDQQWFDITQGQGSVDYGMDLAVVADVPPRQVLVMFVEPGSPAALAGITRGAEIIAVDGEAVENGNANVLNAGLFNLEAGESHDIEFLGLGETNTQMATLTAQQIDSEPVPTVEKIAAGSDTIGYLLFNSHNEPSEAALVDAINELNSNGGINDLVLDLRYNGGGFLDIASELGYMIAGPTATMNQTFELISFNDKHPNTNPVTGQLLTPTPFHSTTQGFSVTAGQSLPSLDLPRVFVLTGGQTCSASESIINSLRGIGVEVYQFGTSTCGKPYGFYGLPNCGRYYFTIQFKGENAAGFGDYADGFSPQNATGFVGVELPGCQVGDDLTHLLGDADEGRLAAALAYRDELETSGSGVCPDPALSSSASGDSAAFDSFSNNFTTNPNAASLQSGEDLQAPEQAMSGKIIR